MPVWRAMLPILRDGLKELAVASVASNGTTVAMRRKSSFSVQRLNSQVQVNLSSKTKIFDVSSWYKIRLRISERPLMIAGGVVSATTIGTVTLAMRSKTA